MNFIQKTMYRCTAATLMALLVSTLFFTGSATSFAQAELIPAEALFCPIDGEVSSQFVSNKGFVAQDNTLFTAVELTNSSSYNFSGVRIGVGVYASAGDVVPLFWTVLPEAYQVNEGQTISVPVELSLAAVPTDSYFIKSFAAQGDETATLGIALRDTSAGALTLEKESAQSSAIAVQLQVNGKANTGTVTLNEFEPLTASVVTTNGSDVPFTDAAMLVTVAQGSVPIGTAVREQKVDTVKLIPGKSRATELVDTEVEGGEYSVYAVLLTENALQPLQYASVRVADTAGKTSWVYVSKTGVSEYPLQTSSTITSCLNNIGDAANEFNILDVVGIDMALTNDAGVVEKMSASNTDGQIKNYFTFTPNTTSNSFSLVTDLLENRFVNRVQVDPDAEEAVGEPAGDLQVVASVTQTFTCESGGSCDSQWVEEVVAIDGGTTTNITNSFWFYAGIMIAAALLLLVMLRRLPPEEPMHVPKRKKKRNSDNQSFYE